MSDGLRVDNSVRYQATVLRFSLCVCLWLGPTASTLTMWTMCIIASHLIRPFSLSTHFPIWLYLAHKKDVWKKTLETHFSLHMARVDECVFFPSPLTVLFYILAISVGLNPLRAQSQGRALIKRQSMLMTANVYRWFTAPYRLVSFSVLMEKRKKQQINTLIKKKIPGWCFAALIWLAVYEPRRVNLSWAVN